MLKIVAAELSVKFSYEFELLGDSRSSYDAKILAWH